MPYRAWFRHMRGDLIPPVPGNRLHSGTRTSCKDKPEVTEARNDHLPWMSSALKPRRSVSTRKPRMRLSSFSTLAQMMATSAMVPEVIHIFSPLRTYSLPTLVARVRIPPGLDPKSGSVKPKQPSFSPFCRAGSQVFFCSPEPKV